MFSVLVIRLRSLRLLRVSGIVMRLRMFLLLITFLKASHSFRNRLRSEERFSRNAETDLVCRLLLEKKKNKHRNTNPKACSDTNFPTLTTLTSPPDTPTPAPPPMYTY